MQSVGDQNIIMQCMTMLISDKADFRARRILKDKEGYYIKIKMINSAQARWWLMPVIRALWEAKSGRSPEVRHLRIAWPIGETLSLLKI